MSVCHHHGKRRSTVKVTLVCKEVSAKLMPAMIYEEALRRVDALATVHPHFEQWSLMPSSADEADIPMSTESRSSRASKPEVPTLTSIIQARVPSRTIAFC